MNRILSVQQYWKRTTENLGSRLPTGWRFGACMATFQAIVVLLLNIVILIWSGMKSRWSSSGPVFQGDCDTVGHISIGIHLVINVLSTLLLGASNYVMQSLCAPTRSEVDKAHARGSWLNIGGQSLRNLKHQSRSKKLLWLALCTSSIPLHLFDRFAECDEDGETFLDLSGWQVLDSSQCLEAYATDFVSDRNDVIVMIGSSYTPNGKIVDLGFGLQAYMTTQPGSTSFDWICSDPEKEDRWNCGPKNTSYCSDSQHCSSSWKQINPLEWDLAWVPNYTAFSDSSRVNYCISQPVNSRCQLESNLPLLVTVIIFNMVKVVCMALAAGKINDKPLVTIGDAIVSFTDNPDPHTIGMCLVLPRQFKTKRHSENIRPALLPYQPKNIRWLNAATRRHWILTICLAFSIVLGLLVYAVLNLKSNGTQGLTALWQLGIGKPHAQTIIRNWAIPTQGYGALTASVLVANSPQLILSMIYIVFNSLCTTLFLELEWSSYARFRKPLRVSSPTGEQRSTYFLQIPYRFALPLMAYSTALHWLVSQSIFLVKINYQEIINSSFCGYSPMGMILSTVVAASLILSAVVFAFFRHLDGNMPLAGSCSTAISAACHPPEDGADSSKPLKWGVVLDREYERKEGVGHISFSSGEVLPPILGYYYS
ncbi:hypothetical protein GYMLUDRAFT_232735 [Collybiopsis luxurians FD-317 M1]|uniref:DUF6536 domain-containing protein n=1 Tax=Collybiopsis luxurians FD-317 M1 TaxID=944289 RepID=A0A0D0CF39_9AGAR|nr:hypothetical protein GYMLUDRAFT_232735 [Collybiopsis luxurians FD-317 M1]